MTFTPSNAGPIGVFDSGYGGLTILECIRRVLPQYDYIYLGDNARAPYGPRSFDVVYDFTRQAVKHLLTKHDCTMVILACNTASAKALRSIQQKDLLQIDTQKRVLGIIRPTAECIGDITQTRHIGVLATQGTIQSKSYEMEIRKLHPDIHITGVSCPLWAAIVEAGEAHSPGAECFVKARIHHLLSESPQIDTIILGCTHYPLLLHYIRKHVPPHIRIITQGQYVAQSLKDYLYRHPEIEERCTQNGDCTYLTTENCIKFQENANLFLNRKITAQHILLT